MKFQNPSLNFFFKTDGRTDKPKPICSPLFQSWGHNEHYAFNIFPKRNVLRYLFPLLVNT